MHAHVCMWPTSLLLTTGTVVALTRRADTRRFFMHIYTILMVRSNSACPITFVSWNGTWYVLHGRHSSRVQCVILTLLLQSLSAQLLCVAGVHEEKRGR